MEPNAAVVRGIVCDGIDAVRRSGAITRGVGSSSEVRVLGPLRVRVDGNEVQVGRPRPRLLFALLVLAVSAERVTRFYLINIGGSEPLLISVGAPAGHSWFDEVASTLIATLEIGPDAPPPPG